MILKKTWVNVGYSPLYKYIIFIGDFLQNLNLALVIGYELAQMLTRCGDIQKVVFASISLASSSLYTNSVD